MAWYRTGTVTVTNGSTTVTGVGTAFIANTQEGEEFRLVGAGVGYEIAARVSDTQITLASPYLGATQSGQAYEIVPVRGFVARAFNAVQALTTQVNGFLGTSLAGRFQPGTDAAPGISFVGDTNTGHRNPAPDQLSAITGGVRRWLLSNSALQIDVPVTGTAVTADANDVTAGRLLRVGAGPAQAFRRGNILGTVSQTAGVPTGAVIERGSNGNGEFVRYADGTQICTQILASSNSADVTWTYPAAFAAVPTVVGSPVSASNLPRMFQIAATPTATAMQFNSVTTSATRAISVCHVTAIGRWF